MATDLSNYNQTVVTAPTAPSTTSKFDLDEFHVLVRERVRDDVVMEPKMQAELNSARSFFDGERMIGDITMLDNLEWGQTWRVNIEKDQNPLSLFQTKELEYDQFDDCHEQLKLDCEVPCINTLPEFEYIIVRFDCEWAYGVRGCDKNKDFWDVDYMTRQYAKSRDGKNFGQEVALWNKTIRALIATPATTVDALVAECYPTHYWADLGTITAAGRKAIGDAYEYLTSSYSGINPTVFMSKEAAHELILAQETLYGLNNVNQRVNTYKNWEYASGFQISDAVSDILGGGIPVVIMKRSPWLVYNGSGTITSQYPLFNEDATKQYVAILDPGVAYMFTKEGYHLDIRPYDCDKLDFGMIDTEYSGSGLTFPQLGMVLEFDMYSFCENPVVSA